MASSPAIEIEADRVPLLTEAARLAQQGFVTGASHRNWASYGENVTLPPDWPEWRRHLLTDPQTSGGLLVACGAEQASGIVNRIATAGYSSTRIIGRVEGGGHAVKVAA